MSLQPQADHLTPTDEGQHEASLRSPTNEHGSTGSIDDASATAFEKLDSEASKHLEEGSDMSKDLLLSLEAGLSETSIPPSPSAPSASVSPTRASSGFPRSDYVPPLPGTGMDATNVFIKYLPTDLTNAGLYTLFSQFGDITSCKVMVDPITGYSLGYGFVRFTTVEAAANAISNMYGQTVGNKTLLCKLSHGIPQNNATPSDNLYIKPLLDNTSEADLLALFTPYGKVLECKVMLDKNTGQSRQIGFVRFATIEEATRALAANNGRYLTEDAPPMVVKYAESRTQKIARRAKLLANQVAAEARRSASQMKQHHLQQQAEMAYAAEAALAAHAGDAVPVDASTSDSSEAPSSIDNNSPTAINSAPSMPYVIKDEYGNVTFAPDHVEAAEPPSHSPHVANGVDSSRSSQYWNGSYHDGPRGPSGGRRGGGPRRGGGSPARGGRTPMYQPAYHAYNSGESEGYTEPRANPHNGQGAVYRKKGQVANYEAAPTTRSGASLPTFNDSPTHRVQLAGKVEVGENGNLVAPDWADDPTRLFVSYLPADYDAAALQTLFESQGQVVSAKISQDKRSPRPKTYGFVQYATPEAAAKAVKELHGTVVNGRGINVAYEATQSVAKHKHDMQQMYYMQQPGAPYGFAPSGYQGGAHTSGPSPRARRGSRGGGVGGRGGHRGGYAGPQYPPYYPYADVDPYMYMVDPTTGSVMPYPVYYPGAIPYGPPVPVEGVAPPEAYYPPPNTRGSAAQDSQ